MAVEREVTKTRKTTNVFCFKDFQRSSGAALTHIMD